MNSFNQKAIDMPANTPAVPLPSPDLGGPAFPGGGSNVPTIPLPPPGSGGPAFPGGGSNVPTIPLPPPGSGDPAFPGGGSNIPTIPLPSPGSGDPAFPGGGSNIPTIPLPPPGSGGPAFPGPGFPTRPRPQQYGTIRFLNAATGYQPLQIQINGRYFEGDLTLASLTPYRRISSGLQTVTISGSTGYVYLRKSIRIIAGEISTIAIINTDEGLDLMPVPDIPCSRSQTNTACLRVCNLAYYSNPMNVMLYGGTLVFKNVGFQEVTPFKQLRFGEYQFYLEETSPPSQFLVSFYVDALPNKTYTVYILNSDTATDQVQTLILQKE